LKFFIDGPAGSYCDPLAAYFATGFFMGGGLGHSAKLGRHEQVFHLNEWIRFDRPGKYRLYVTSSRVSWRSDNVMHGVELVSPVVAIEVREPTADELSQTYRQAVAVLTAYSSTNRTDAALYEALSRLRYLDTEASRLHLRSLLGGQDGSDSLAMFGLIGTRETDAAIALLEAGIPDPEVAITSHYGYALARLRQNREDSMRKEQQPGKTPSESSGGPVPAWPRLDYFGDRADWKKLVEAFDRKTGRARAVCASSLFALINADRQQQKAEDEAKAKGVVYLTTNRERLDHDAVMARIRAPLAESFLELTENEQRTLLEHSWELIRGPELLPPLGKIVAPPMNSPDQSFSSGLQSLALLRLADLDPAAGRPLILEDVRRLRPRYSLQVLCSLPTVELKKEVPLLASNFAAEGHPDTDKIAGMISHIADGSVFDRVEERYLKNEGMWECITQTHCLQYFIKVRRPEGLDLAFSALLFRGEPHTHCYSSVASRVLAPHYGADVERRMLDVLRNEPEPEVITDMTRVLLQHGTKAVIDPLLEVVERLSSKAINEDYSYDSEAGARRHVVEGLIRAASERYGDARWRLTPPQKARLKSNFTSNQEVQLFGDSFKTD
jgi:hypothetical protein